MRIAKDEIPVRIDVPGATARQVTDFGDATGYSKNWRGIFFIWSRNRYLSPYCTGWKEIYVSPHTGGMS